MLQNASREQLPLTVATKRLYKWFGPVRPPVCPRVSDRVFFFFMNSRCFFVVLLKYFLLIGMRNEDIHNISPGVRHELQGHPSKLMKSINL